MYRKDAGSCELFDLPEYATQEALELLIPEGYHIQTGQGYVDIFNEIFAQPVVSYTNQ